MMSSMLARVLAVMLCKKAWITACTLNSQDSPLQKPFDTSIHFGCSKGAYSPWRLFEKVLNHGKGFLSSTPHAIPHNELPSTKTSFLVRCQMCKCAVWISLVLCEDQQVNPNCLASETRAGQLDHHRSSGAHQHTATQQTAYPGRDSWTESKDYEFRQVAGIEKGWSRWSKIIQNHPKSAFLGSPRKNNRCEVSDHLVIWYLPNPLFSRLSWRLMGTWLPMQTHRFPMASCQVIPPQRCIKRQDLFGCVSTVVSCCSTLQIRSNLQYEQLEQDGLQTRCQGLQCDSSAFQNLTVRNHLSPCTCHSRWIFVDLPSQPRQPPAEISRELLLLILRLSKKSSSHEHHKIFMGYLGLLPSGKLT